MKRAVLLKPALVCRAQNGWCATSSIRTSSLFFVRGKLLEEVRLLLRRNLLMTGLLDYLASLEPFLRWRLWSRWLLSREHTGDSWETSEASSILTAS